jgi:RNA recognition motif-containing protein
MEAKLYVGNLSYGSGEEELRELFAQAGNVVSASVITDRDSGRSKGFAFVEMSSSEEAEKAIQMFDGYSLDGRDLRVSIARPREERSRDSGGGRDRHGRGGGQRRY